MDQYLYLGNAPNVYLLTAHMYVYTYIQLVQSMHIFKPPPSALVPTLDQLSVNFAKTEVLYEWIRDYLYKMKVDHTERNYNE